MQTSLLPDQVSALPNKAPEYDLRVLLEAGCHFGHQAHRWHPRAADFIYMEKDGVHIFDLAKTAEQLTLAYNYMYQLGKQGKVVVFVATKRQARDIVKAATVEAGLMSITSRWLGGLLTNWEQISKSLKRMVEIEDGLKKDTFKGYTKYERVQLEKELSRLIRFFDGIRNLKGKPDALFVVDTVREDNALIEANTVGVPVVALVDSNANPFDVTIPIPGNDDAVASISYIVTQMVDAYKAGRADK